ncbi:hypothetical protein O1611_g10373 [Lasiodiplodia mahajangana]|uniref:Uncharacterized protein n=1 Tax=Lasiodiplodia mahajangana TaxID=1108764 RepID=A0ACC2IZ85_9PEZI|nr:hypothetical protein O1611_g10373 [Lasiodiplodia mahajangana]
MIREPRSDKLSNRSFGGPKREEDDLGGIPPDRIHEKKGLADYVVVMDIARTDRLANTLARKFDQAFPEISPYSVNQTMLPCIERSPIAVSIKTQTKHNDHSVARLRLWTSAWYRRMHQAASHRGKYGKEPKTEPMLVTALQIIIDGHEWKVYFVCDCGGYVKSLGPLSLGTTETLNGTYALFAALERVKEWIEKDFLKGIESWLWNGK